MSDEILFPTDGNQAGDEAAKYAYDQAKNYDATLHVLHVIDETETAAIIGQSVQKYDQLTEESQGITANIASEAPNYEVDVVEESRQGDPAHEILNYVEKEDIDLLVMSTRGRSGIGRVLKGSTTEKVLRQSVIPVLAVPR